LLEADKAGMGIVTMRTLTSGLLQKWIRQVNPSDSFDYTPALLQFVLSNSLVDVALVGMRTVDEVEHNVAIAEEMAGRIDISALHAKYV
jgi:predicted aldo/keto reductase-like oxidoreductase